ncbi:MAG: phosphoribosylformylglycinamidine synthase subunit PurS [Candidatus Thermoplasmatota archaeon]|jgi:phosphoribosylformylglycinamidine synthase PurS subunit|nr:phosphoribosylformylglycinamidine synthase subunit PurS [Candidatus Thermoplasmatota archaeon]MCL5984065.1 phosphoribosylformylglycinamidine synthase subunit PurS [Candidatus Thermoplasmatota archaeon]
MGKAKGTPPRRVEVRVELKPGVMDAEALSTEKALGLLGVKDLDGVHIARVYELTFTGIDAEAAMDRARECVERLLANPVIHQVSLRALEH